MVWELNRHQHLVRLGQAFRSGGDERFAAAVVAQINSWIRDNPAGIGINWVSSLELAFRCISWLWALALIRPAKCWNELAAADVANSLHDQALHVERFLSTYSSPNTHLTGEALGLYYIGCCMPELRHAARWRSLGRQILIGQLAVQIRPDGVYFEQASWYHRYTADFYTHFLLIAQRTGDELPALVSEKLEALFEHLLWLARPDGTFPNIGDDDGGKLIKLDRREPGDWRAALSNAAVQFRRGDFRWGADSLANETLWLFGVEATEKFAGISARPPAQLARAFTQGGYFIMRDGWGARANYCLIDCGPHGHMNAGHAHADVLSIEVAALGATMLVDPGTCSYSQAGPERDLFRSAAMHNTVTVDRQSSSVPAGPFKWRHVANGKLESWLDHAAFTFFAGSHDGYRRLSDPVVHRRQIFFPMREYWVMLDQCTAISAHDLAVNFHFAPGVNVETLNDLQCVTAQSGTAKLDIVFPAAAGRWEVDKGFTSPCYGQKLSALKACYEIRANGSNASACVLFPRGAASAPPQLSAISSSVGPAFTVSMPHAWDILRCTASSGAFEWLWMRRQSQAEPVSRAVLLHGRHLAADDFALTADRNLAYVVVAMVDQSLTIDLSDPVGLKLSIPKGVERVVVNGRSIALTPSKELSLAGSDIQGPG